MVTFRNNAITGIQSWGGSANNGDITLTSFAFSDRNGQVSGAGINGDLFSLTPAGRAELKAKLPMVARGDHVTIEG